MPTPLRLLTLMPLFDADPNAPDMRLMMLSAAAVIQAIARSPLVFLYATASPTTAAAAVVTAISAP